MYPCAFAQNHPIELEDNLITFTTLGGVANWLCGGKQISASTRPYISHATQGTDLSTFFHQIEQPEDGVTRHNCESPQGYQVFVAKFEPNDAVKYRWSMIVTVCPTGDSLSHTIKVSRDPHCKGNELMDVMFGTTIGLKLDHDVDLEKVIRGTGKDDKIMVSRRGIRSLERVRQFDLPNRDVPVRITSVGFDSCVFTRGQNELFIHLLCDHELTFKIRPGESRSATYVIQCRLK